MNLPDESLGAWAASLAGVSAKAELVSVELQVPFNSVFDPVQRLAVPEPPPLGANLNLKVDDAIVPCLKKLVVQFILPVS